MQDDQKASYQKAHKFREEQLCAFQTLGDWQKVGFQSYSTHSSLLDQTGKGSTTDSVTSIVDQSVTAAIVAKNRVLKWQEERSRSLVNESATLETSVFKVPLPKPAVTTIQLSDWFFGLRSRNWVLVGKFIDGRGKTKKYSSKSLFDYFERKKQREIWSLDRTKTIILFGSCGQDIFIADIPRHPNFIKNKFRHGFPRDWKEALNSWSEYRLAGEPSDYQWPDHNTSVNSVTSSIVSNFTSVTDRVPAMANATRTFHIPRNIGVEVDSRYVLNKFLDTTKGGQSFMSCTAETSNQLPNNIQFSVHNLSNQLNALDVQADDEQTLVEPQPTVTQSSKVDCNVSQKSDNIPETRFLQSPKQSRLDAIMPRVPSNVARSSSSSTRQPETLAIKDCRIDPSSKEDRNISQKSDNKSESSFLRSPKRSRLDAIKPRVPSNVARSSSSSTRQPETLAIKDCRIDPTSKDDRNISQKNGDISETRFLQCPKSYSVDASEPKVPSKYVAKSSSNSSRQRQSNHLLASSSNSSKENHSKLQTDRAEQYKVARSSNQPVSPLKEVDSKSENVCQPLAKSNNHSFRILCGKAIDPTCSFENCVCNLFPERDIVTINLIKIDAAGSAEERNAMNMKKQVGQHKKASPDLSTKKSNGSTQVLQLANWRPVVSETGDELLLAGEIVGFDGRVVEKCHLSSPVVSRKRGAIRTSDGNQYNLVGKLSVRAKNDLPSHIASNYFKNDLFPTFWKKMMLEWNTMSIEVRTSTRHRKRPIEYWKVDGGRELTEPDLTDDKLNVNEPNKKKRNHGSKEDSKEATKVPDIRQCRRRRKSKKSDAKVPNIHHCIQNSQRHLSEDDSSSSHRSRSRSQKSTRITSKKTDVVNSVPTEIPNSSTRLNRRDLSKHSSSSPVGSPNSGRKFPKRSLYKMYSSEELLEFDGSENERTKRSYIHFRSRSTKVNALPKVVRKSSEKASREIRRSYKLTSSDESTDVDTSVRALTANQKPCGNRGGLSSTVARHQSGAVGREQSDKSSCKALYSCVAASSDFDENEKLHIPQDKTAARDRPRQNLASNVQVKSSGTARHSSSQAAGRSVARNCGDTAGTAAGNSSKVRRVKHTASVRSGRKEPLYPWESDADISMDSDLDTSGAHPPVRTQKSAGENAEKVNQNTESRIGSYPSQVRTSSAKQIDPTSPVSDSECSTMGVTNSKNVLPTGNKSNKNSYETYSKSVIHNPGNNVCRAQSTTDVCQNEDAICFDDLSFTHSVPFSETGPLASKIYF